MKAPAKPVGPQLVRRTLARVGLLDRSVPDRSALRQRIAEWGARDNSFSVLVLESAPVLDSGSSPESPGALEVRLVEWGEQLIGISHSPDGTEPSSRPGPSPGAASHGRTPPRPEP